jgi:hypothetical protein
MYGKNVAGGRGRWIDRNHDMNLTDTFTHADLTMKESERAAFLAQVNKE